MDLGGLFVMIGYFKTAWYVLMILLVGSAALMYVDLPDRMAVHFDMAGNPNGWMGKQGFYVLWFITLGAVNVWPPLLPRFSRWMLEKINPKHLSLPNKEYWLSTPALRKQAGRIFDTTFLASIVVVDAVLLLGSETIRRHAETGESQPMHWGIIPLIGFVIVFSIAYPLLALRRPRTAG